MPERNKVNVLLRMLKLVKPLKWHMVLAVTAGTLGFLCAQLIPILGGYGILSVLGYPLSVSLGTIMILLPLLAAARAFLRYTEQKTNHYIAFTLLAIIRDHVFRALRRLCPAKLESRDKGDLIALMTSDVELMEVFFAHTISPICIAVITETIMCLLIGRYHWSLGLLALAAFGSVGILIPLGISKRSGTVGDDLRRQSGDLAAFILENIYGLDETIQYDCGEKKAQKLIEENEKLSDMQRQLSRLSGVNLAISNSVILCFDLAMLVLAGNLYLAGIVSFEGFLIPVIALLSSFGPVSALAALGTTLQATIASGARILSILDELPETEEVSGKDVIEFTGAELKHVHFAYQNEPVLKDLSAQLKENRITGVVGASGCGKSTMLKLLMRFWKTDPQTVLVSDQDISEINTDNLRSMESYMTQDTDLFKGTIADNIRIAKLDASEAEVIAAGKKASLHDFVCSLPNGYDTQLAELGDSLSSGERQRIGLARVFLHDAPFVLLDEPTSSLDSLNEAVILKSLKEEKENRTIVLVSHRLSTVRIADDMIQIEDGHTV